MAPRIVAKAETGDGGSIVLTASSWRHIYSRHPEMAGYLREVLETVVAPDVVCDDPRPGRLRYYRLGIGPSKWLRAVVDFNTEPARIVTAHGHRKEPVR